MRQHQARICLERIYINTRFQTFLVVFEKRFQSNLEYNSSNLGMFNQILKWIFSEIYFSCFWLFFCFIFWYFVFFSFCLCLFTGKCHHSFMYFAQSLLASSLDGLWLTKWILNKTCFLFSFLLQYSIFWACKRQLTQLSHQLHFCSAKLVVQFRFKIWDWKFDKMSGFDCDDSRFD